MRADVNGEGRVQLFLDKTPFYAESGGQIGDQGLVEGDGFSVAITDVQKARGGIVHIGQLVSGEAEALGGSVSAKVNGEARAAAARNHTATHLLHEALRQTLGEHVGQMGSLVTPDRLRFDFSHFVATEPEQLLQVVEMVNEESARRFGG